MSMRLDPTQVETLPKLWKAFSSAGNLMRTQELVPQSTLELVNLRASQINGCGYCVDMHTIDMAHAGETAQRIAMVAAWREAPYFTDAERAALLLAEEATRIADAATGVSDEVWDEVRRFYDEEQAAILVGQIAMINAWNRFNVTLQSPAGNYTPGQWG
ncbi:AhpD family alkylhydroperoxidase [Stackebrandtia endophytica]|uniref:AhpD family alkylhydroperoxidase n=1 Tax=Stackebrandtia endophytica TaxID=1496996 RepID=A0A543B3Q7_9ACTN|nr:carboxymuconolactone decarboxylase family protein [Stackebrandtia endophytica]TQL79469.1 AhpD family alkylhydroperoxidase [Stackebrandtia endophytica]